MFPQASSGDPAAPARPEGDGPATGQEEQAGGGGKRTGRPPGVTGRAGWPGPPPRGALLARAAPASPAAMTLSVAWVAPGDPGVASPWTWAKAGPASAPTASTAPATTVATLFSLTAVPLRSGARHHDLSSTHGGRRIPSESSR